MSRRHTATKRPMAKDGKYQNTLVSRLVNTVMISGKKSTAERIVYGAFDTISEKNPASSPIEILQRAVDNAKPRIETKARRVGGATYQVPLEIPAERQNALALRWIVDFADAKKGTPMKAALATEILEAFQGQGNAIRKRDEVHKMALPCPWKASRISVASAAFIGVPFLASAKSTIQRSASAFWRSAGISSGT